MVQGGSEGSLTQHRISPFAPAARALFYVRLVVRAAVRSQQIEYRVDNPLGPQPHRWLRLDSEKRAVVRGDGRPVGRSGVLDGVGLLP